MTELPLFTRARSHGERIAFRTPESTTTYSELLEHSARTASALLAGSEDLNQTRVALLVAPGSGYTSAQWGIWRAGAIKVPLCLSATEPEWDHALRDAQVSIVIADASNADRIEPLANRIGARLVRLEDTIHASQQSLPEVSAKRPAMILYTSGTTNKPKGVLTSHTNIQSQISSLVQAWEWSGDDSIPLFLPLHHIHGIINILGCALWSGACVEAFPRFDMETVLGRVSAGAYSVFMAVPTIYVKLIDALEKKTRGDRDRAVAGFRRMRLMVSGSAALPASIHEHWTALTGQTLLERYGMTEIGMALSHHYRGERRPGSVGAPLPGVEVRLKAENGDLIEGEELAGEIQVRGPGVFGAYWNRPQETAESFEEGWFRTGDMAVLERGYYRILGRLSVDIIKSGGYKLGALEIEAALLEHPDIRECAVLGMPDATWGEAVTAVCVPAPGARLDLKSIREWTKDRLSAYKVPQRLHLFESLPRNAMGKVTKPAIRKILEASPL